MLLMHTGVIHQLHCQFSAQKSQNKLEGCIVLNEHNTVFVRSGPLYATAVSLDQPESLTQTAFRSLHLFLQGSLGDRPTDRPTDHATRSVTIGGAHNREAKFCYCLRLLGVSLFVSLSNCRYCADRAQSLLWPAPNIWLTMFQISSESVITFKSRLDKFWSNQEIIYDYRAEIQRNWKSRCKLLEIFRSTGILKRRAKRLHACARIFRLRLIRILYTLSKLNADAYIFYERYDVAFCRKIVLILHSWLCLLNYCERMDDNSCVTKLPRIVSLSYVPVCSDIKVRISLFTMAASQLVT